LENTYLSEMDSSKVLYTCVPPYSREVPYWNDRK